MFSAADPHAFLSPPSSEGGFLSSYVHYFIRSSKQNEWFYENIQLKSLLFPFFKKQSVKTEKSTLPFLRIAGKIDRIKRPKWVLCP